MYSGYQNDYLLDVEPIVCISEPSEFWILQMYRQQWEQRMHWKDTAYMMAATANFICLTLGILT